MRLDALRLEHARQWGACWLGDQLWRGLHLDVRRTPAGEPRGHRLGKVLRILTIYRLLSPGSEWRLHRHWFATTALADLLGVDERAGQDDTLYRGLDLPLAHKEELFVHLRQRWSDLFGARYEILLISGRTGSRPISSWPSSPTACPSPCASACADWRPV